MLLFFSIGLILLLSGLYCFLVISGKKKSGFLKDKASDDISELKEQQNFLLEELQGFLFFHNSNLDIRRASNGLGYSGMGWIVEFWSQPDHPLASRIKENLSQAIEEKKESLSFDFEFTQQGGEQIWIKISEKLLFDNLGRFIGGMGICKDISEQQRFRIELIKKENRLRDIFTNFPDLIFIIDREDRVVDVNLGGKEHLFFPAHTILGKKLTEFVSELHQTEILNTLEKSRNSREIQTVSYQSADTLGGIRYVEMRILPLGQDQVIFIAMDSTGQKIWEKGLMEALNAANLAERANSEFFENMSHDIQTPINGLMGVIDLLENTNLNKIQKDYLETAKHSGKALLSISKGMVEFAKIQSGKYEIYNSNFDPEEEVKTQIKLLRGLADKKEIELVFEIKNRTGSVFKGDKEKINQVLQGLLGEVIKNTTEKGKLVINLEIEDLGNQLIYLHFQLTFTGIGIFEDQNSTSSKKFSQGINLSTGSYQGTSFSLVLAKKIIELLGGEFSIESKQGKESVFRFSVLVKKVLESEIEEANQTSLTAREISETGFLFPLKILLSEDNDLSIQLMTLLFEQLGYDFEVAKNGFEVLEKVKEKDFDLVLMDVQMPLMNGLEATKHIRSLPDKKDLIIIGLSANAFEEDEKKAFDSGMTDYMTKPIRIMDLVYKLEYYFKELKGN